MSPRRYPWTGYLPIEDHGLIGDGRGSALVGLDGAISFMCVPRFDALPLSCSLLDLHRGGSFLPAPDRLRHSRQANLEDTGVLVAELRAGTGVVEVTDAFLLVSRSGDPVAVAAVAAVAADAVDDLVCGFGPLEGPGLFVPGLDPVLERGLEFVERPG